MSAAKPAPTPPLPHHYPPAHAALQIFDSIPKDTKGRVLLFLRLDR